MGERLLAERIVVLGQQVDDEIANRICSQLLYLEGQDDTSDIWLYINSPGGSVTAGMAVYDTMQFVRPDVATVGLGLVASMGQFLLCSGARAKRYVLPHTRVLMHQPLGGLAGVAADIAIQAESLAHTKATMADLFALHTGQTRDRIVADWDRDRWFTAEGAREYGIVDQVLERRSDLPFG